MHIMALPSNQYPAVVGSNSYRKRKIFSKFILMDEVQNRLSVRVPELRKEQAILNPILFLVLHCCAEKSVIMNTHSFRMFSCITT